MGDREGTLVNTVISKIRYARGNQVGFHLAILPQSIGRRGAFIL